MNRWEVLSAVGTVVTLFLPVVIVFLGAHRTEKLRELARQKRIADYRRSPESRPLILN